MFQIVVAMTVPPILNRKTSMNAVNKHRFPTNYKALSSPNVASRNRNVANKVKSPVTKKYKRNNSKNRIRKLRQQSPFARSVNSSPPP